MFWRKKKVVENRGGEKAKKAIKKIEGPLWGYMVTQRGVVVDVLQNPAPGGTWRFCWR